MLIYNADAGLAVTGSLDPVAFSFTQDDVFNLRTDYTHFAGSAPELIYSGYTGLAVTASINGETAPGFTQLAAYSFDLGWTHIVAND